MIEMVALVPQPPLLVPQLAAGLAEETTALRSAALLAAARLAEFSDNWIVLAADPEGRSSLDRPPSGTFVGYGVDLPVALSPTPPGQVAVDLPLPLLIAGWLRGQAAPRATVRAELIPPDLGTEKCRAVGIEVATSADVMEGPIGLLVVGDGATRHTDRTTGRRDDRCRPFDDRVAAALRQADPAGLLSLDADLGVELDAAGRAPWQVLAGAVESTGGAWHGELIYSEAPYGVAYHVALWQRQR